MNQHSRIYCTCEVIRTRLRQTCLFGGNDWGHLPGENGSHVCPVYTKQQAYLQTEMRAGSFQDQVLSLFWRRDALRINYLKALRQENVYWVLSGFNETQMLNHTTVTIVWPMVKTNKQTEKLFGECHEWFICSEKITDRGLLQFCNGRKRLSYVAWQFMPQFRYRRSVSSPETAPPFFWHCNGSAGAARVCFYRNWVLPWIRADGGD